ncbi:ABC transporter permease [Cryptosporangium aurantiacum]|uniref:Nucleoside ABC transporter membrane protein n=1 Tax=Cryptosporangium aurantiacum TaxID=134849 RepID=A0A1M7KBN6_9ACTN|nr:ABC transporter permease [Cryptosporangium aurantiacum]SHM62709.1 nucleoside ABC transporter membrane protein [Cryptosporangium aurantiacum]
MNVFTLGFVAAVLIALAPVLLAALGGALCARVGVFNIGLEGQMLLGCFTAVAVSAKTGSALLGVAAAVGAGVLTALVLAVGTIRFRTDPIVLAIGTNLLAVGLTGFLLRSVLGTSGTYSSPDLAGLTRLGDTWVGDIPVLGDIFHSSSWVVVLSLLLVPALAFFLARHPAGLRLRGIGENPEAARSLGVHVDGYQQTAILVAGALCGLAGAQLALGNVQLFSEQMTAGRGWVAVVAVMLGRGRPGLVLAACVVFGAAEAFGFRLQGLGLPQQATDAAPYVITLIALLLTSIRRPKLAGGNP